MLYAGDHLLPHVHIKLKDGRECTIDIDSLKMKDRIAEREVRNELEWISNNRTFLHEQWRRYNP